MKRSSSGLPDLRRAESDSSRLARNTDTTRTTTRSSTSRTNSESSTLKSRSTVSRYAVGNARSTAATTTLVDPPTYFNERGTTAVFRPSHNPVHQTHSHGGWHWGGHHHHHHSHWYTGFYWNWGSFSFGWHYPSHYSFSFGYWPGYWSWHGCGFPYSTVYYGSYSAAYLYGNGWYIQAYPLHYGFHGGGHYFYFPRHCHRRYHRYCHNGFYFYVHRPYWYDYGIWWDYRPYSYGYSRYVYERLDYEDGYEDGYDRGYEDGAEDSGAYRDGRKRDSLRSSRDDMERDRERGDAREEFAYEMEKGQKAFADGDYDGAVRAFKEAVILDPSAADAKFNLAIAAFASGKYAFSAFGIRRGLAINADAANQKLDLREFYKDQGVLARQMADLDAAIAKDADADKLLVQGYVRLFTGDANGAAQSLERATNYAPQDEAVKTLYKAVLERLEKK